MWMLLTSNHFKKFTIFCNASFWRLKVFEAVQTEPFSVSGLNIEDPLDKQDATSLTQFVIDPRFTEWYPVDDISKIKF